MRILMIGAGAVGGYFGARLAAAGRDVTFLVHAGRAEQLRLHGLQILSPHGDFSIQPQLLLASDLAARPEVFDLVVVSTKSYSLPAAMDDFAPAVGHATAVLPLLNGIAHLDALDERFGHEKVVGGTTTLVADLDPEGRVRQIERLHDLTFGERVNPDRQEDGSRSSRIQALDAVLRDANFDAVLSPDVLAMMWRKWVFLAALGATTCMLRGSIGAITAVAGGAETARALVAETNAIAAANGYPTGEPFLGGIMDRLTQPGSQLTASMFRDMIRGRPVEADHILGDLLARGRAREVAAPLLQAACAQLSVYMRSLAGAA